MNDEIKEILDRIETASEIFDCLLKPEECTELLDYITNLQQDNTMYAQLKDEYEEEIKDLQRENERLKHQLNQEKPNYLQIWQLEDRIDKAIEYIGDMPACIWNEAHEYNYDFDSLLNILHGENDE